MKSTLSLIDINHVFYTPYILLCNQHEIDQTWI